ncbi:MAG: DUF1848 domain-containing protein [Sphingomonadales bacterium]
MIVSASYRTDIPAFYGKWFVNRLNAGSCTVANPYGGPDYQVSLRPADVDGFVFWTRNIQPFGDGLRWVEARAIPFMVQFTITGYPHALETSVPDADIAVDQLHRLARAFGPKVAVWRYDPVLITSLTPPDWHVATIARLAARLAGACDEVVVSFAHIYRKTRRNLDAAAAKHGFTWCDPDAGDGRALLVRLADAVGEHGMTLSLCSQPDRLTPGVRPARCIDADRLSQIAGRPIPARRKGNRPGCECHESRDVGAYDSCPHGCVYCYAVSSKSRASAAVKAHDPLATTLISRGA